MAELTWGGLNSSTSNSSGTISSTGRYPAGRLSSNGLYPILVTEVGASIAAGGDGTSNRSGTLTVGTAVSVAQTDIPYYNGNTSNISIKWFPVTPNKLINVAATAQNITPFKWVGNTFSVYAGRDTSTSIDTSYNGSIRDGRMGGGIRYYLVPTVPQVVTLSRSGTTITATVTTGPTDNGGTAVTDYNISINGGGAIANGSTFTGSLGTTYTARAIAINAVGSSEWSGNIGTIYVPNVPTAPTSYTPTRSGKEITFSWASAGDGGASIDYYDAYYSTDGSNWTVYADNTASTSASFTASAGNTYYLKVYAHNEMGWSGESTTRSIYVPSVPTNPTISQFAKSVTDARKIRIAWTPSSFDGATSYGYDIQSAYSDNGTTGWSTWADEISNTVSSSYTSADLLIAKYYKFRIRAQSDTGDSSWIESSTIFVSAYGYRYNGTDFSTPITSAKIFVGIGGPGADENGWRSVQNTKKWNGTDWVDLQS